jgi:hypothetical protein
MSPPLETMQPTRVVGVRQSPTKLLLVTQAIETRRSAILTMSAGSTRACGTSPEEVLVATI